MKEKTNTKSKLLIFDFDGTIADTKSLYYKAIYNELKILGYKYRDIGKVIDLGISLKNVLKKFGFSFITSWFLHRKIMKNVKKYANEVKKCKDADSIKEIGTDKLLVSNSLKEFIMPILRHFKLQNNFKEIYGAEDFTDKAGFIRNYLKENKIKKENCYYIGDRAADVKTARKAGCRSVIVSGKCAWNSRKEILKEKPDFLIADLKELKRIVRE